MFWVILSGADVFEWGYDLALNAKTITCDVTLESEIMTCDVMPKTNNITSELARLASFPTEKGNASQALKKRRVYRHSVHSIREKQQ
jgi:hypothetical protein